MTTGWIDSVPIEFFLWVLVYTIYSIWVSWFVIFRVVATARERWEKLRKPDLYVKAKIAFLGVGIPVFLWGGLIFFAEHEVIGINRGLLEVVYMSYIVSSSFFLILFEVIYHIRKSH